MKFMKKTVLCVALVAALFLAIPANAQFKFGPKVGMNICQFDVYSEGVGIERYNEWYIGE